MAVPAMRYTASGTISPEHAKVAAAQHAAQGQIGAARAQAAGQQGAAKMTAQGDMVAAEQAARGQVGANQASAVGQGAAGYYSGFGQAEAGRYGGLGMLAGAMAQDNSNRYGAYAAAEGNRQTAMANEAAARYGANAMAEVGRQTTLGNLGSAALGAYGSNANQAMNAWALNQQAYNQALSQMSGANQGALAGLGMSRNAGLQGGFTASGPGGPVASGSYGDTNRYLMDQSGMNALQAGAARDMQSLNEQHATSRGMPMDMQRQTFADLLTMNRQSAAPVMQGMNQYYQSMRGRPDFAGGMNQFYGAMERFQPDYSGVLGALNQRTSMGAAPTLQGMFGDDAVGANFLRERGPVAEMLTKEFQKRDSIAATDAQNAASRRWASERRANQLADEAESARHSRAVREQRNRLGMGVPGRDWRMPTGTYG